MVVTSTAQLGLWLKNLTDYVTIARKRYLLWNTINLNSFFGSGPTLARDDVREHMGEAENGPDIDRRLEFLAQLHHRIGLATNIRNFF